jgi:hypothetical protein
MAIDLTKNHFVKGQSYKISSYVGLINATFQYSKKPKHGVIECHFTDAFTSTKNSLIESTIASDGRVALKNYDGDKKTNLIYNPDTNKSVTLKIMPVLRTDDEPKIENDEKKEERLNNNKYDERQSKMNEKYKKEIKELQADLEKSFPDPLNRLDELKSHIKAEKIKKGNLFKEGRRTQRSMKINDDLSFEEGKTYSIPVDDDVIIAVFNRKTENNFLFKEAEGYLVKLITDDGRVGIKKVSGEYVVFNPETQKSSVLHHMPTLLSLEDDKLDESLSDLSNDDLVYNPLKPKRMVPSSKRAKKEPRKKSMKKSKPIPKNIESFLQNTRRTGMKVVDFNFSALVQTTLFAYPYLMKKYKSRCIIPGKLKFNSTSDVTGNLTYVIGGSHSLDKIKKAKAIVDDLLECIDSKVQAIFIPLSIKFLGRTSGHANMLIYRPFMNLIERFEPSYQNHQGNPSLNAELTMLFEQKLKNKLGKYVPKFEMPQAEMNKALEKLNLPKPRGLQFLEMDAPDLRKEEDGGYCQMWSLFVMECILINPEKPTKDIIQECYDVSNADPQYLRDVMRGYVQNMNDEIQKSMGTKTSIKKRFTAEQAKLDKILQNGVDYAAHLKRKHNRTQKNEGSASSHSSDYKDSSGFSSNSGLSSESLPSEDYYAGPNRDIYEFLTKLGIQSNDAVQYTKSLVDLGGDDMHTLREDMQEVDLKEVGMSDAHFKLVSEALWKK